MIERTLGIIKPDAVANHSLGPILGRIEGAGLEILGMKMIRMNKREAEGFYQVHRGKPFFDSVTNFMSSGPCVVMTLSGEGAIRNYRDLMGPTDPKEAAEGTIRYEFGTDIERNAVHGSDSLENAGFEIGFFFSELELTGE